MEPIPPVTSSLFAQFEVKKEPSTEPTIPVPGSLANPSSDMGSEPAPGSTVEETPPPPPPPPMAYVSPINSAEKRIAELERQLQVAQENTVSALIQLQKREEADKRVRQQTDMLLKESSLRKRAEETDRQIAETIAADRRRIELLEQKLLESTSPQFIESVTQSQRDFAARIDALSAAMRGLSDRVDEAARMGADGVADVITLRRELDIVKTSVEQAPSEPDENMQAQWAAVSDELRRIEVRADADRRAATEDNASLRKLIAEFQQRVDAFLKASSEQAAAATREISEIAASVRHNVAEAGATGAAARQDVAASAAALRQEFSSLLEAHARNWRAIVDVELPGLREKLEALRCMLSEMKSRVVEEARAAADDAMHKAALSLHAESERRLSEVKSYVTSTTKEMSRSLQESGETLRAACEAQLQSALQAGRESLANERARPDSFEVAAGKAVEEAFNRELAKASAAWRAFVDVDMARLRTEVDRARADAAAVIAESQRQSLESNGPCDAESEGERTRLLNERISALKAEVVCAMEEIQKKTNDATNASLLEVRSLLESSHAGALERTLNLMRMELSRTEATLKKEAVASAETQSRALRLFFNGELERLRSAIDTASALAVAARDESSLAASKAEAALHSAHEQDASGRLVESTARVAAEKAMTGALEQVRAETRALIAATEEAFRAESMRAAQTLRQELESLRKRKEQSTASPRAEREDVSLMLSQQELAVRRQFEAVSERFARFRRELESGIDERLRGVAQSLEAAREAERRANEADRKVNLLAEGCARRDEQLESELHGVVLRRLAAVERKLSSGSDQ